MVISMERWKGKVAVVTGASSGIGYAIAEHLADAGLKVVGVARRREKLEELQAKVQNKGGQLYSVIADFTKKEDVVKAFQWIGDNAGPIHILVNSAGTSRATSLFNGDPKLWKEVLDINVLGLCMATKEAIKNMRANSVDGHIVHINSVAGHRVIEHSGLNIYIASKYAVTALTETLKKELLSIGSKIKISSVSPGIVATDIFETSVVSSGKSDKVAKVRAFLENTPHLQPSDVAEAVVYVLSTPSHVQIHELTVQPLGEKL